MPTEYFEQRERALLGQRYEQLYAAPQQTAERGVTVSALRTTPEQFAQRADFPLEPSPFCKAAFVVHQPDFKPGRHPYHHAGVFYSQEPSASSAAPLLGVQPGMRVLDLCAGSGCVGLAVAANVPGCRVVLADVSEAALRLCKQNVRRNELNARVTCVQADALEPPDAALWDFDVIACNPPYIPTGDIAGLDVSVRDYEPRSTLDGGADGLDFYRAIAARWGAALRLGGALLFEVGIGQAGDVGAILAQNQFEQIQTFQDTQGIGRVVEGVLNS